MKKGQAPLKELARLFLKLGVTAFGGPAAHIAMMQREVVDSRGWMSHEHFLDLIGATNLIPGPNSTEMAIHIGQEKGGLRGLALAGICFISPAVALTLLFAWLYKKYGHLPGLQSFLYGIKPAIIVIILAAIYPLARKAAKTAGLITTGIVSMVLCFGGLNEIYVIFGAGLVFLLISLGRHKSSGMQRQAWPGLLHLSGSVFLSATNIQLFWTFLKIGSVLYGSGYVLFAFLDSELVQKGLLSRQELIDAIAVGQFTPGPVFSSVTFIGYQINGLGGALFSTLAVFTPSFVFVWLLNPLIPRMRRSVHFGNFLDAVNIASIAAIVYVCYQMGKSSITDWRSALIALVAAVVMFGWKKMNSAWVIAGSSLLGFLLSLVKV
jgi:chromate transporter